MAERDYKSTCFVVMPFGKKRVGRRPGWWLRWPPWAPSRVVDFDWLYDEIFAPAIEAAERPEGGKLRAHRADRSFYSGNISTEMFEYIEYSRLVLADISGLNANVFLELGARYRAQETGTVVLRQVDAAIPFDVNQVRAFPYEYEPRERAAESRALITRVLGESLQQLRIDSPIAQALGRQFRASRDNPALEELLRQAEDDVRSGDSAAAAAKYEQAVCRYGAGPLTQFKLALHYKANRLPDAARHLEEVVREMPTYAEAFRELGIVQNKMYSTARRAAGGRAPDDLPTGEEPLRHALSLSPDDYDAHASLGGILKRAGRYEEARAAYQRAVDVSNGHPYPLLNEMKLQARAEGRLVLDERRRLQLVRARRMREAQTAERPRPLDVPWSFFDLAEIRLYEGDARGFLETLQEGIEHSCASWQLRTFRESLELLAAASPVRVVYEAQGAYEDDVLHGPTLDNAALHDGIAALARAERALEAGRP